MRVQGEHGIVNSNITVNKGTRKIWNSTLNYNYMRVQGEHGIVHSNIIVHEGTRKT